MTHQVALTIITRIKPGEVEEIKQLLKTIGNNVAQNDSITFGKLSTIHFARLMVLDVSVDLNGAVISPSLVFISECDAPLDRLLGEFLLGYPNEYGLYTDRPLLKSASDPNGVLPRESSGSASADLGRNGSYLVFRKLRQDVRGFWQFLDTVTKNPDGNSNPAARLKLASQMIGRWPSGAPLLKTPKRDDPQLAVDNDFAYYQADPYGFNCPIGSHIRRTNPRDSLVPALGYQQSTAVGKRHRIIRRGREYGPPVDPAEILSIKKPITEDQDRGLYFLCLNANISHQFEFIQHTWVNNPHFNGLYDDADPILGVHYPDGGTFTIQTKPVRKRFTSIPNFISVVGGVLFHARHQSPPLLGKPLDILRFFFA